MRLRDGKIQRLRKRKCWEAETHRKRKPQDLTTQVETKVTESTADRLPGEGGRIGSFK